MLFYIIIVLAFVMIVLLQSYVILHQAKCKNEPQYCTLAGPHSPYFFYQKDFGSIVERDRAVMQDPLYPPVSRDTVDNTMRLQNERRLQPDSPDSGDTYQLIGYLINRDDKTAVWKLMARSKNRGQADFYVHSSNTNLDVKLPLNQEIAKPADGSSTRPFRDLYDLPESVLINHPLFGKSVYDVSLLPRANLGSGYL